MLNSGMASVILSPDLICEILRRLSVKDLLRFRCVSKSWCSLIDDSGFIKLHLSHSVDTSTNLSVILLNRFGFEDVYSVNFDSLKAAQRLEFPGEECAKGRDFAVLGSCNGLLALFKRKDVPLSLFKMSLFKRKDELYLWNPSTKKSQMLPVNEIGFTPEVFSAPHVVYGFAYDHISDDYKLLRIVQSSCLVVDFFESEVMVYSLKTNYWRRRKDFPFYLKYTRTMHAVLANNALHCEVSTKPVSDSESFDADFDLIAAFDLATEEYHIIGLPDCLGERLSTDINVMGGCLCLIATYQEVDVDVDVAVDIWIMKEYGVKESWTKLLSVKTYQCFEAAPYVLPLVFSKNGDKVLLHVGGMLFFYDLRSKKADKVNIEDVPCLYSEAEMMVESLVPLNGNGAMFNNKNQHSGKTKRKNTERDNILSKRIH
ncbi:CONSTITUTIVE EXPRESSER OF PR GENES 1, CONSTITUTIVE EXPRESSER OF PR GENES 30 [Hibiscus trionum]|uniref:CONSTITUTIVE EXPRESSER OF PR GENES 1, CONSTITUTIVE EXPRESSER OF PR GENES 30 n=1 Tax=Hibiscus trionum TaxID=183268 RepID=A0A9W7ML41_HIBTR|nr:CONSTITUTIVE EXPRESSER OF PR GENES 1, CONSTITUTIVE EXPRESSER OF PR GENES 30 [Hibiscus trionum]